MKHSTKQTLPIDTPPNREGKKERTKRKKPRKNSRGRVGLKGRGEFGRKNNPALVFTQRREGGFEMKKEGGRGTFGEF